MKKINIKSYPFVRSHFRAKWRGIIIGYSHVTFQDAPLCMVLITHHRNNKLAKKKRVKVLSQRWLQHLGFIDMCVYDNWLDLPYHRYPFISLREKNDKSLSRRHYISKL